MIYSCVPNVHLENKMQATWVFGPVVILLPKKPHSSMRVWFQSLGSSNIRVYEFRLEFLSYLKKKKKKKKIEQNAQHIIKKSELKTTLDLPLFILFFFL